MSKNSTASSGIGFAGLLTIAFIVLKLTEVIDWSWIWVLSPLWLGIAAGIGIFLIIALFAGIGFAIKSKKKPKGGR